MGQAVLERKGGARRPWRSGQQSDLQGLEGHDTMSGVLIVRREGAENFLAIFV